MMWVNTELVCLWGREPTSDGPLDHPTGEKHHCGRETAAQCSFVHPVSMFVENILHKQIKRTCR